jgi:hypothetical protein
MGKSRQMGGCKAGRVLTKLLCHAFRFAALCSDSLPPDVCKLSTGSTRASLTVLCSPLAAILRSMWNYKHLLLHILIPNPPLHGIPGSNPINPFQQMREWLHLILSKASPLPTLHPRPSLNICHGVFTLAGASEPIARAVAVLA